MAESSFRHYLIKGFKKVGAVAQAHEDTAGVGIVDVSFTLPGGLSGWMELKSLDAWPVRLTTPVKIRHLTEEQVEFLKERGKRGAPCYIALRVWRDYCFIPWEFGDMLRKHGMAYPDILFIAHHWERSINWSELIATIKADAARR